MFTWTLLNDKYTKLELHQIFSMDLEPVFRMQQVHRMNESIWKQGIEEDVWALVGGCNRTIHNMHNEQLHIL
jgi:hypothetical protein